MKKAILLLSLVSSFGFSQNINDALLFSKENIQGTARYNSMSGAFGALGGDMSAINVNPAGAAVFNNSNFTGTFGVNWASNEAEYFGTITKEYDSDININQLGGVLVLKNTNESSDWKKSTFALTYSIAEDFDKEYVIRGSSPTSISSYFLAQANGLPLQDIQKLPGEFLEDAYINILEAYGFRNQQAFLGYYGGVIDPVDSENPLNTSYLATGSSSSVNQDYVYISNGYNSKFNFNMATQYKDMLYLGMSLNGNFINSERITSIRETGYDASSELSYVYFDNRLRTLGSGFSFQLGAIAKVGNSLRLGASYHSPTWYVLNDELSQSIGSNLADRDIGYIGVNQVIVFENYNLRTPSKLTGSAAIIFGKQGLLSVDYHYKDYDNAKLCPESTFSDTNRNIDNLLKGTSSLNLGGEYRIDRWSLRAGCRYEESPFRNNNIQDDLMGYSFGFGYNFGKSKLDFSFSESIQDTSHQLYDIGLTERARITEKTSAILASYTINM
jgi:hypothetical protein